VPFVGVEAPQFEMLPAAQRYGVPLPDLFGAATGRRPVLWIAAVWVFPAGFLLGWPAFTWFDWVANHGVLPMHSCSAMHWGLADAAAVFSMWCVMLVIMGGAGVLVRLRAAMRLPNAAQRPWWQWILSCCADGAPAAFAVGHVASALGVAALLTALNGALANVGLLNSATASNSTWAAPWLMALGFWQCLPLQRRLVLRSIERPLGTWDQSPAVLCRRGWRSGWRMAAAALPPMLALFALGIMNLVWMLFLLMIEAAEQQWPRQKLLITRLLAVFWLALGAGLMLRT
jgi:hypothetical protein